MKAALYTATEISREMRSMDYSTLLEPNDGLLNVRILHNMGIVTVSGWSIHQNIHDKYGQILSFLEHTLMYRDAVTMCFKYELFNPSTARYLFKIIKLLNHFHAMGHTVTLHWLCGETHDEILDAGMDFRELADFDFRIGR